MAAALVRDPPHPLAPGNDTQQLAALDMAEQILHFLDRVGMAISLIGVLVIAAGVLVFVVRYALEFGRLGSLESFRQFRLGLGRALILGLEIMVVADVIETITVEPTLDSLLTLAMLVAVRTLVSWTLSMELEGRWPWQPARSE